MDFADNFFLDLFFAIGLVVAFAFANRFVGLRRFFLS